MGSLSDFIRSASTDSMLPFLQQALSDVVMEVLTERQIPTRTDFHEIRDLVNSMRTSVSTTTNAVRKIETRLDELETRIAALEPTPKKASSKKKASPRKKASQRAPKS